MGILEIENVNKSYGINKVLKNVSLTVNEGERVVIIGSSGGGKTTLLRCASTLEIIDDGQIRICGLEFFENKNGKPALVNRRKLEVIRSKFGFVFQDYNLFPHFTVKRNITEALIHVDGLSVSEADAICEKLLGRLGLGGKMDVYPSSLSGGQKQRVSIARALARNPQILFFDEPTSALDPELIREMTDIFYELSKDNMTMVIVTHDMQFASKVADKIVFMDDGCIIESGSAEEIINNPKCKRTQEFLKKI